ncbi:MAG: RnfABCDGE type electron transport complex subunit G [Clostridia bacterium]
MQNDGHKMSAMSKVTGLLKNDLVRLGAILFLITAITGCCLGFVYESTKDVIADKKEEVNQRAYAKVLPDAGVLTKLEVQPDQKAVLEVYRAENGGVAMKVMGTGYGGDMEMAVGIDADGNVTGVSIISHGETPGLGAKATEADFIDQYSGKNAKETLTVVKGDAAENEISAISGATITSRGVTEGVNEALQYYTVYLKEGN